MVETRESVTAKLCSFARAFHSNIGKNKIFDDYLAYDLMGRDEYEEIGQLIQNDFDAEKSDKNFAFASDKITKCLDRYITPIPLSRIAFAESELNAFARRHGKCQYVICGAGMDTLMSFYIAEHKDVSTPFMANLDGFVLTHTYEVVDVPTAEQANAFLPKYETDNKMDLKNPRNLAFSAGPDTNTYFKYKEHLGILNASKIIDEAEERFAKIFGRRYTGLTESYRTEDADYILITLGSLSGLVREVVDELRKEGSRVGLLRLCYLRPFPNEEIAATVKNAKAVAVLEKDISFGNEGTVYTNVNSALQKAKFRIPSSDYIGGLGGRNISKEEIKIIFDELEQQQSTVKFLGIGGETNGN